MLRYLKIRLGSQKRRDGSAYAIPQIVTKRHRFSEPATVQNISRKRPVLIEGASSAGKTRMAQRLAAKAPEIWGAKHGPALWLGVSQPISAWAEQPEVEAWATRNGLNWRGLRAWQRVDLLPDFVRDSRAVVFLDDAHNLSGSARKTQIARDCLASARCWVVTCSALNRLPPNLRETVERRQPQAIQLKTDAAFDGTNALFWVLLFVLAAAGAWQASVMLGVLRAMGGGRWAAKQQ